MSELSDAPTGAQGPLKKLELALREEVSGGNCKKDADFKEAYELIEQNLTFKVSQKKVLAQFNAAYGYQIYPPRFRKMLDDERARRADSGDVAVCAACGQYLASAKGVSASSKEIAP